MLHRLRGERVITKANSLNWQYENHEGTKTKKTTTDYVMYE